MSKGENVLGGGFGVLEFPDDGIKATNTRAKKAADLSKVEAGEEMDDCLGHLGDGIVR